MHNDDCDSIIFSKIEKRYNKYFSSSGNRKLCRLSAYVKVENLMKKVALPSILFNSYWNFYFNQDILHFSNGDEDDDDDCFCC